MKPKIHPKYVECKVSCGCGHSFVTQAAVPELVVEICSNCHPFYTGKQKFVDTAGRVEKFQKKFGGQYFKKPASGQKAKAARA
ncbi:MAG: 50S ribosomal protein L31 [Phycisphaerae bacterium]|nr:50S ribosomal protein L31 [Phycisphaerae bacterium]